MNSSTKQTWEDELLLDTHQRCFKSYSAQKIKKAKQFCGKNRLIL